MIQQLHWAIRRLKKDHLLVLYYRYWKDLSQAEVADLLSLTQQGVCYREQRALHLLKTFLENKKTTKRFNGRSNEDCLLPPTGSR